MHKPAFTIEASGISDEDLLQCRLLVEVNPNAFTYVLLNQRNMSPLVVRYFQLEHNKENPLIDLLQEILEGDELLKRPVKETLLIYNFPESSLVPEAVFTMDTNREIIDTLHGNLQKGLILTEKIPWWELFNVYRISSDLHQLLQHSFSAGKYWHYYSLLLKSYKMFDSTDKETCIKVIFYSDKMVVLVIREGTPVLVQTFNYHDSKDVAYHLLNCCNQLGLDQEAVRLLVGGLIDRQSALSTELHKYFLKIQFEEIDESIKVTDELKELPLHYFFFYFENGRMRIIGGELGGRRVNPPAKMPYTRPTTDIAKEGLFNVLENNLDLSTLKTLDLFGGTGSISYELASRGVRDLTVVEKDPAMFVFIQKNSRELGLADFYKVVRMDVFKFIGQCTEAFDLIFAGPPYALETIDELPKLVPRLLNDKGWFVLEHTPRNNYEGYPLYVTQRHYGTTIFSIFVKKS